MCHHVCRLSITITLPIVAKRFTIVAKRVSCVYNCCQTGPPVFPIVAKGGLLCLQTGDNIPIVVKRGPLCFQASRGQKRQDVRICARVQIVEAAQKIDLTMHLSQCGLRVFRVHPSGGTAKVSLEADLTG